MKESSTTRDFLGKLVSLQLGLLSVTRDKVKGIVDELIRIGDVSQEEATRIVDDFIKKGERNKQEMREEFGNMLKEYLEKLDVPTRTEINELKYQLTQLREDLARQREEGGVARKNKGL